MTKDINHTTAHSGQAETTTAQGAPSWLDFGLCYSLGSPNLFKSRHQRGRRRLYQMLSVAVTNYIISVHACKSYAINAVSGFTKKCLLVMYHTLNAKADNWDMKSNCLELHLGLLEVLKHLSKHHD